jgi:hypothetical protein
MSGGRKFFLASLSMKQTISFFCLFALSAVGFGHEASEPSYPSVLAEGHELYHRAQESYLRVDTLRIKRISSDHSTLINYYFDATTSALYSCVGEGDFAFCLGPEKAKQIVWTNHELTYGRMHDLVPIHRETTLVYFLEGMTPFNQWTAFVYYTGRNRVVKCRGTDTSYNFEANRDGDPIYFQSEKDNEWSEKCEQLYPRPS